MRKFFSSLEKLSITFQTSSGEKQESGRRKVKGYLKGPIRPLPCTPNVVEGTVHLFALIYWGQNDKNILIQIMIVHETRHQNDKHLLGVKRRDL